ncbi:hypothetical protein C0J52_10085 [Blattella germanica]|nr:hypothetical protein C0J52_10085 [Blattella germanica]
MTGFQATGVSERSLRRILGEGSLCEEQGNSFGTPGKSHSVPKRITDPDEIDEAVVRRTIYNFYIEEKTVPTVKKRTRLIILHAGGSSGFIPGALRILKSHLKTEDYHGDMNFLNYMM